ncbi:MAG: glucosyl-3-phosphoglycerate synthase [Actinobacteria bacterium]|nr:glucosyl-3-phosphoglycerate synthase [Actinomycetota bacterium]
MRRKHMADVRPLRLTSELSVENLVTKKNGRTISVCIPARNEAATIAPILLRIKRELMDAHPLVDQLIVMDHESTDQTAEVASECGATVISANDVMSQFGPALGKGDVLWRSVEASTGDIVVWLDADLASFTAQYVTALVEPMLNDDSITLVRANYLRTLHGEGDEGGRVTELTARPILKLLYPELSHIRQPLGGEYAIRRDVAQAMPFEIDYGVEIGLLIDIARTYGVDSIAQAELGVRTHRNRPLTELHEQAIQVMRAALTRDVEIDLHSQITVRPALNIAHNMSTASAAGQ